MSHWKEMMSNNRFLQIAVTGMFMLNILMAGFIARNTITIATISADHAADAVAAARGNVIALKV